MDKATIKKNIKNLIISSLVTLTIGTAVLHVGSEIRHKDNSPISQTYELQRDLGFTGDYRKKDGRRLEHNNGEPIYVTISDKFNDEQREIIIEQLNQFFGLVGSINDNYKYEIVENVDSIKYLSKSTIKIRCHNLSPQCYGETSASSSLLFLSSTGKFNHKCDVKISTFFNSPESAGEIYARSYNMSNFSCAVAHELFHCFGVTDLYNLDTLSYNSLISVDNKEMTKVSPNDYKLLVSLYSKSLSDYSKEEKEAYLKQVNDMIEEYTQSYYEQYCKQKQSDKLYQYYDKIDEDENIDVTFSKFTLFRADSSEKLSQVRIKTQNGKYTIAFIGSKGQIIDKCSGKLRNIDGALILEGVHLTNYIKNKDIYIDFYLTSLSKDLKLYQLTSTASFLESTYGRVTDKTENIDIYQV